MRFAQPASLAGKTELESSNLRIRLVDRDAAPDSLADAPASFVSLEVENRRSSLAHIDSYRSCLIDPERGATNLCAEDRILPPMGKVVLSNPIPGGHFAQLILIGSVMQPGGAPAVGASQRMLLSVNWEDGVKEDVDVGYEVVARQAAAAPAS